MDSLSCLKSQPFLSPSFPPLVPLFLSLFTALSSGGIAELETSVHPHQRFHPPIKIVGLGAHFFLTGST